MASLILELDDLTTLDMPVGERARQSRRMGNNARSLARSRFGLDRFVRDWNAVFTEVCAVTVS